MKRWNINCLTDVIHIPDRNTIGCFEKRIGQEGARALFEEAKHQLSAQGFIPRGGQIIDATLIPVPKQHNKKKENEQIRQGKTRITGQQTNYKISSDLSYRDRNRRCP
ncbi:transposase [Xenorhabdus cabanillasii JM26]|nr:transposase [Xenorhabdus cabanillasii JM26]